MARDLLARFVAWLLALVRDEADDTTDEDTNTDGQGEPSDNETNASQPPSRPATEPHTPQEPEEPERDEQDEELNRSGDDDEPSYEWEYPPYVGDPTSDMSPPWPKPPMDPVDTIEVRLYWQQDWQRTACKQCVRYVEYFLLDAYADQDFDADVQVHPDPIPSGAGEYDDFKSWYWSLDAMAKDANIALVGYGGSFGSGGGYGGWIDPSFFKDWSRDPDDLIKNVGGDGGQDGPTFGVIALLHEIGHCLGLGHVPGGRERPRVWGDDRVSPMDAGYEDMSATRYVFELHPSLRGKPPKVQ